MQKFMKSVRQQRQGTMEIWDTKIYLARNSLPTFHLELVPTGKELGLIL